MPSSLPSDPHCHQSPLPAREHRGNRECSERLEKEMPGTRTKHQRGAGNASSSCDHVGPSQQLCREGMTSPLGPSNQLGPWGLCDLPRPHCRWQDQGPSPGLSHSTIPACWPHTSGQGAEGKSDKVEGLTLHCIGRQVTPCSVG